MRQDVDDFMPRGQVEIVVGVVVLLATVVAIVAGLAIYVGAVITLKIFGVGGVEVVNTFNTPYIVANTLITSQVNGKPFLEHILEASVVKNVDAQTMSKISAHTKELLDSYDFSYVVELEGAETITVACTKQYDSSHKAVDISAGCGTPVKAVCGGRLETIKIGFSSDPVYIGTLRGNQQGLKIEHDDKCEWPDHTSLYGCIEVLDKKSRNVKKGDIIGYVSTCDAEKEAGCHLHFGMIKGYLRKETDPKICDSNKLYTVVEQGTNILARKGAIGDVSAQASIPLIYKNNLRTLVVTIGER